MRLTPLQQNFAAGELSPRFLCRNDIEAVRAGCRVMENMYPVSQGPAVRRAGTIYHDGVVGAFGRSFGFNVGKNLAYVLTVTDGSRAYVHDANGRPTGTAQTQNSDFSQLGANWTDINVGAAASIIYTPYQALITLGDAYTGEPAGARIGLKQSFSPHPTDANQVVTVLLEEDPDNNPVTIKIGTTDGGSEVGEWTISGPIFRYTFDKGATPTFWIELSIDRDKAGDLSSIRQVNLIMVAGENQTSPNQEFVAPAYTELDLREMEAEISPGGTDLYLFTRRVQPQKFTYVRSTDTWAFQAVDYTAGGTLTPPAEWTGNNWPGAVFFYQGRKWVGGPPDQPNIFYASKSGSYEDFQIPTASAQPNDPFSFIMTKYTQIRWIAGLRQLMIGTDRGEFIVESTDGDVIYPGNIDVRQQSQHGSRHRQPALVGNNILFASPDGRKVKDTGFRWTEDAWVARDLIYVSEHITAKLNAIKEIHWAPNPENLLYCPTDIGEMLIGIYEWNNNIVGWSRHSTQGEHVSTTAVELGGRSRVFHLSRRAIASGSELHLEEVADNIFMDDAAVEVITGATKNLIVGGAHLAGRTVQVVTDGAVHPDVVISDGGATGPTNPDGLPKGQAYLQRDAVEVQYGYGYRSLIVTMPLDGQMQGGSLTGFNKARHRVMARIYESALPRLNNQRPPDRTPSTPMDTAEPLRTQDIDVTNLGWNNYAEATVSQDLPLPLTLLGIFGDATVENI